MTEPSGLVPLFSSGVLLLLFGYVFGQQQRSATSTAFLLFCVGFFFVSFLEYLLYLPFMYEYRIVITRIGLIVLFFVSIDYLFFCYSVAEKKIDLPFRVLLAGTVLVSLISLFFPHHELSSKSFRPNKGVVATWVFVPFALTTLIPPLRSIYLCFRGWRSGRTTAVRNQCRLLFWGTMISSLFGAFVLIIIPVLLKSDALYRLTSLAVVINAVFLFWAIRKHGLMTINSSRIKEVSRVLFQNMSDGVIVSDVEGTILQLNPAAREILIAPPVEGQLSLDQLFPSLDLSSHFSSQKYSFSVDDIEKTIIISHTAINEHNRNLGCITLFRDITEQQKIEKVNSWKNKLESIGYLAGGVAHDFNNQLTGIMGCADLLREKLAGNETDTGLVDLILKAANRSSQLTQQLLAFSRKGKYQEKPVSINELIEEVTGILSHTVDKRINIVTDLTDDSTVISGDPNQLQNIFLNIALNGCDAMPNGGTLTFTTKRTPFHQAIGDHLLETVEVSLYYITVHIKDTGSGIPETIRKQIFEPFFTTKEKGRGSGMGLAAVYGSVQEHQGSLEVKTECGKGTEFTLCFPAASESVSEQKPMATTAPSHPAGKHLLIIEDEEVVAHALEKIVRNAGYTATVCNNGRNAIEHFKQSWKTINAIILDLVLPDVNGFEVFKALKEIHPDLNVLLASGYAHDQSVQEIIDNGAADFIQKPFIRGVFLEKLASVCTKNDG